MSTQYDITQDKWERFTFSREGRVLTAAITSDHPVNGVPPTVAFSRFDQTPFDRRRRRVE